MASRKQLPGSLRGEKKCVPKVKLVAAGGCEKSDADLDGAWYEPGRDQYLKGYLCDEVVLRQRELTPAECRMYRKYSALTNENDMRRLQEIGRIYSTKASQQYLQVKFGVIARREVLAAHQLRRALEEIDLIKENDRKNRPK